MASIRGRVLDLSTGPLQYAYLYGFRIDHAELQPEHKQWLWDNILSNLIVQAVPPITWHVWLCGTTSRTGAWVHNLKLSERRADAVAKHLETAPGKAAPLEIHKHWNGELTATLKGRRNEVEHPLDRAVVIAVQPVWPQPTPVPAPPPVPADPYKFIPCCDVRQELEFLHALRDTFSMLQAQGKPGSSSRQSFGGDPYDTSDVPRAGLDPLDQRMLKARLLAKGWTDERAEELSKDPVSTVIRIDGLHDKIRQLGQDIEYLERQLSGGLCSPHDPLDICRTGKFRKY